MAIQDDFTIDYVDRKITYTTSFVADRPPNIYTVNELYSFLQDTFDEPAQMDDPIPMSAQTPTQYTMLYPWFIDNESVKALYGGSIQSSSWTKASSEGVTALRWDSGSSDTPIAGDIGVTLTGGSSGATGVILAVDTTRSVVWVRNTSAAQFTGTGGATENVTGTGVDLDTELYNGALSGESVWSNLFSVGSLQLQTDIYVGQEDDQMGGTAFHVATADGRFARRMEKLDEWWDSDVDFFANSPNLLGGVNHFDILTLTQEMGSSIDGARLAILARQFSKVYSQFELVGGVGNFVVPFASTGADLNSQDGPYTVPFDARANNDLEVGDVLENTTGAGSNSPEFRLRAVVTAVTGAGSATGTIEYYLIGENEPLATTDRTLLQLADNDNLKVRGDDTVLDVNGTPTQVANGPATVDPGAGTVTITFADTQVDVDEDAVDEEYACTIDCAGNLLADVYKRVQFLTSRGNQDATVADTQDTLLPGGGASAESSEFYRAVGDVVATWDANAGTGLTEGQLVTGSISGAYGVVVSATTGATGTTVLTQVKGTFVNNDVVSLITDGATNTVTLDAGPTSITDNTAAPFGSFAGGRWFLAQGVIITNVPVADANNWQSVDLTGTVKLPPTVRTITFAGLTANDRAALFEVDTSGGIDITKDQNGVLGVEAVGSTALQLDASIALDVPSSGWVRVVDTSSTSGAEYRFEYASFSTDTVTLVTGAGLSGTATSLGSSTVLNDTGAFATYGTTGQVKTGMEIINDTDGSIAVVLRKIDNNSIETTVLTGGSDQTWASSDTWTANAVVVALAAADTVYFPFIDDEATASTISSLIKYVEDTDLVARARFSDPDVGGTRILPFEQKSITLTDANLTVTAIRTTDTIAS